MSELNIKKQVEEATRKKREFEKFQEELKSRCSHTNKGELTITKVDPGKAKAEGFSDADANKIYMCKQCHKYINISALNENDIKHACDVIDRVIDTIKMTADPSREDDSELIKKLGKIQYRVRNDIPNYYKAASKKNGKGRKRNNSNDNNSVWGRPTTV